MSFSRRSSRFTRQKAATWNGVSGPLPTQAPMPCLSNVPTPARPSFNARSALGGGRVVGNVMGKTSTQTRKEVKDDSGAGLDGRPTCRLTARRLTTR